MEETPRDDPQRDAAPGVPPSEPPPGSPDDASSDDATGYRGPHASQHSPPPPPAAGSPPQDSPPPPSAAQPPAVSPPFGVPQGPPLLPRPHEPLALAAVPPALTARAYGSHRGLGQLDPWPPDRAAGGALSLRALWPWGLGGLTETLEIVGLALLMFVVVQAGARNFVVDGSSMVPTFENGQMVIVNKLVYRSFDVSWLPWTDDQRWQPFGGDPTAGDVVVFHFPQNIERDFIKRVVATPGQTVEVMDGQVFVDGEPLAEPYLQDLPRYRFGPETVPPGQLFVLGDNRNNSYDSHQWGMLERELVIGRADLRYWPLDEVGLIGRGDASNGAAADADPAVTTGLRDAEVSLSP